MAVIGIFLFYLVRIYSLLLVVYALLSWFPGGYQSALGRFIGSAVEPVLRPFYRLPLRFGGLDFTIWFVLIVFNFLLEMIVRVF